MQSLVLSFFVIAALTHPEVLVFPVRDYHFIGLVNSPPPVPQKAAPLRSFRVPRPEIAEEVVPRPQALRVPAEIVPPKKPPMPEVEAPKVTAAATKERLPDLKPVIPRQLVKTNVFSNGSSATPTLGAAPYRVQTGGFGDPNGVRAQENHGRPITIAKAGAFDVPAGPGGGNGAGGSQGVRGVVASTGFGSGVATGDASARVSTSRGTVRQGVFGDADVAGPAQAKAKPAEPVARTIPAEITFKPRPVYTDEGRQLKVEGEVLLDVLFSANGQIKVVKVVQGLGHGLDESAVRAAEKMQFKPALRDGRPSDFEAVVHVVFQLAS